MSQSQPKRPPRRTVAESDTPIPTAELAVTANITAPPQLPPPAASTAPQAPEPFGPDLFAAFSDSQTAFARGAEALADEVGALIRAGLANVTESATAMLGARTMTDAIAVNLGFARKSFDTALAGSVKVTEIGVTAASEAIRPLVARLGETWPASRLA